MVVKMVVFHYEETLVLVVVIVVVVMVIGLYLEWWSEYYLSAWGFQILVVGRQGCQFLHLP